jgi:hypothetical protein
MNVPCLKESFSLCPLCQVLSVETDPDNSQVNKSNGKNIPDHLKGKNNIAFYYGIDEKVSKYIFYRALFFVHCMCVCERKRKTEKKNGKEGRKERRKNN